MLKMDKIDKLILNISAYKINPCPKCEANRAEFELLKEGEYGLGGGIKVKCSECEWSGYFMRESAIDAVKDWNKTRPMYPSRGGKREASDLLWKILMRSSNTDSDTVAFTEEEIRSVFNYRPSNGQLMTVLSWLTRPWFSDRLRMACYSGIAIIRRCLNTKKLYFTIGRDAWAEGVALGLLKNDSESARESGVISEPNTADGFIKWWGLESAHSKALNLIDECFHDAITEEHIESSCLVIDVLLSEHQSADDIAESYNHFADRWVKAVDRVARSKICVQYSVNLPEKMALIKTMRDECDKNDKNRPLDWCSNPGGSGIAKLQ
jgi:hypothetical protein